MLYSRYRHLAIDRAKPPPTAAQLAGIEGLLGARLPPSFREVVQVANGGDLEYMIDEPFDDGKSEPLRVCSGFCADEGQFLDGTLLGGISWARQYQNIHTGGL